MLKNFYSLSLFFILMMVFINGTDASDKKTKNLTSINPQNSLERAGNVILFSDDFESGSLGNWVTLDETSVPPQWHLNDWMIYGGSGLSWQMADPELGNNGGYGNSWYQVLDTDPINLTGTNTQLTFYHRYSCESPGGEPSGYDGWDGMNVQVTTDNGTSWTVLENPTPAYDVTSLYSFGNEHGEGTGIPGWAGDLTTWTMVTFDLSTYADQTVQLRFAFAADGAYSTGSNGGPLTMFGWQVDDISVSSSSGTLFSNDGTETGMTASNRAATGADLWHVQMGSAASGQYFISCNNSSDTYEMNMTNSITSEWFVLDPMSTDILMDFTLRGSYSDNDVFPNLDYFGAYVQVLGETGRRYVSNITQNPSGSNFVYSSAPPTWSPFSLSYSIGLIDLTSLKGDTIRIIFEFNSDEDTPIGEGLQIDDVIVWTPEIIPVELTSFTAKVNPHGHTILNWNTATETNNRGFEIERRNGKSLFATIGFVEGYGTTSEEKSYSFVDKNVNPGAYFYRLKQIDFNGQFEYSDEIELDVTPPLAYGLHQNYPNPFNPNTNIKFSLAAAGNVKLSVYNTLGEELIVLINGFKEAGFFEINFNAANYPSGTYIYKFETANYIEARKMILMK